MIAGVFVVVAAYLVGSISFAMVVSRAFGLPDPHAYGSGNPGATNVLRTGRKAAAVLTLAGDAAKGWVAVALAHRYGEDPALAAGIAAIAVVLGHVFPLYHRFAGGKGVSTAAGALFALNAWMGLGTLATWIAIAAFFRISSLAAGFRAMGRDVQEYEDGFTLAAGPLRSHGVVDACDDHRLAMAFMIAATRASAPAA